MRHFFLIPLWAVLAVALIPAPAGAHPGWGIVVDRLGQVYFTDVGRNVIWKFDAGRRLTRLLEGKHSHALIADQNGNLYGEHVRYIAQGALWEKNFWKATHSGAVTVILPPTTSAPRGFTWLRDAAGNTYDLERTGPRGDGLALIRRSPAGKITETPLSGYPLADGPGRRVRFRGGNDRIFGHDGSLYFQDGACIRRVGPDGRVSTVGGNPLAGADYGQHPRILGLAADSGGNLYVADYGHHRLLRIRPDDGVETVLRSGPFWGPTGVAVVGDELYVLEDRAENVFYLLEYLSGPRVRRVSSTGRVTTLATVGAGRMTGCLAAITTLAALGGVAWWQRRRRKRAT